MSPRAAVRVAWSLWTGIALIAAAAGALFVITGFIQPNEAFGFPGFAALLGVEFGAVGAVVAIKRPANAIGWIFLVSGACAAIQDLGAAYAIAALGPPALGLPGAVYAAWIAEWIWIPYTGGMLGFLLLLFPRGVLPSCHARRVAAIVAAGMLVAFIGEYLGPGPLPSWPRITNPVVLVTSGIIADWLAVVGFSMFGIGGLLAVIDLAVRWRAAVGEERQQFKWLLLAGALASFTFAVGAADLVLAGGFGETAPAVLEGMIIVGLGTIPLGVGIAITRYRLYDIDRLISRTVSYVLVIGVLVSVYVGGVLLLRGLVPLQGDLAVAVSTLIVASLFNPVMRRIRFRVDRRFNRSHYVAQQELDRFAAQLRDRIDLDSVVDDLETAVSRALEPASARVWLRRETVDLG